MEQSGCGARLHAKLSVYTHQVGRNRPGAYVQNDADFRVAFAHAHPVQRLVFPGRQPGCGVLRMGTVGQPRRGSGRLRKANAEGGQAR